MGVSVCVSYDFLFSEMNFIRVFSLNKNKTETQ